MNCMSPRTPNKHVARTLDKTEPPSSPAIEKLKETATLIRANSEKVVKMLVESLVEVKVVDHKVAEESRRKRDDETSSSASSSASSGFASSSVPATPSQLPADLPAEFLICRPCEGEEERVPLGRHSPGLITKPWAEKDIASLPNFRPIVMTDPRDKDDARATPPAPGTRALSPLRSPRATPPARGTRALSPSSTPPPPPAGRGEGYLSPWAMKI